MEIFTRCERLKGKIVTPKVQLVTRKLIYYVKEEVQINETNH